MTKRINTYVTVGETTYPPGEVSDEVADLMTNQAVFESSETKAPAKKAAAKKAASDKSDN